MLEGMSPFLDRLDTIISALKRYLPFRPAEEADLPVATIDQIIHRIYRRMFKISHHCIIARKIRLIIHEYDIVNLRKQGMDLSGIHIANHDDPVSVLCDPAALFQREAAQSAKRTANGKAALFSLPFDAFTNRHKIGIGHLLLPRMRHDQRNRKPPLRLIMAQWPLIVQFGSSPKDPLTGLRLYR